MVAYYDPTKGPEYNGALTWALVRAAIKQVLGPQKEAEKQAAAAQQGQTTDTDAFHNIGLKSVFAGALASHSPYKEMQDEIAAEMMKKGGGASPDEYSERIQEKSEIEGVSQQEIKKQVEEKVDRALSGENVTPWMVPGEREENNLNEQMKEVYARIFGADDKRKQQKAGIAPKPSVS
jgi:hypothetical protein